MKITREKREERLSIEWNNCRVEQQEDGNIFIMVTVGFHTSITSIEKSEIPTLIKALQEITK